MKNFTTTHTRRQTLQGRKHETTMTTKVVVIVVIVVIVVVGCDKNTQHTHVLSCEKDVAPPYISLS